MARGGPKLLLYRAGWAFTDVLNKNAYRPDWLAVSRMAFDLRRRHKNGELRPIIAGFTTG